MEIEVCSNLEYYRVYWVLGEFNGESCGDEAASEYAQDIHAALERAGYATVCARHARSTCHGWNGANKFARKHGPIGTFDDVTDDQWREIVEVLVAVPVPQLADYQ